MMRLTFQLTRGKRSADNPRWSPDGRWVAFVTEREGRAVEPLPLEKTTEEKADENGGEGADSSKGWFWCIIQAGGPAASRRRR